MSIAHFGRINRVACFGVDLLWLRQFTMLVHHFKQSLDVFIFLFWRCFFVLLKFGYLLVTHVHYDLLRLFRFESLYLSTLLDRVTFNSLILHLLGLNHLRSCEICLLVEGIFHEFFLQPEVLELLLLLALAFLVHRSVKVSQLADFFLLLLLHWDIAKDQVTLSQLILFTIALSTQKLLPFALCEL